MDQLLHDVSETRVLPQPTPHPPTSHNFSDECNPCLCCGEKRAQYSTLQWIPWCRWGWDGVTSTLTTSQTLPSLHPPLPCLAWAEISTCPPLPTSILPFSLALPNETTLSFWPQSTHRVATAAFWRTFHHDGKISLGWRVLGGGVHAHPFAPYLPSRRKLQCTLQLRWQIHSLYFISTLYVLCGTGTCNVLA